MLVSGENRPGCRGTSGSHAIGPFALGVQTAE
jgi:hypothetical protein